ncbi:cupin domain-containing protein [Larkinella rosea]|uniref:Cupin domain-containing protein n=1 Tax=Larkinella rosea TaxID=2025312 RepID=A0A3P1C0V9_9BACT|nr:cupin domain-containing protein [Larkinella rosea]RRB06693.1 cupin domain-containing protein [Larkinella rosea]
MERRDFLAGTVAASLFSLPQPVVAGTRIGDLLPFYLPPATEPLLPGSRGIDIRTRVRHHQTNGQFSCVEFVVGPNVMGPAPHLHEALDELMFVLEGTVSVLVGEEVFQVQAGGWHLRPRGIVHTFWNATDQIARAIDMYFQQPFEEYLEASFHTLPKEAQAKGLSMDSPEMRIKHRQLAEKFGMKGFPEKRQPLIEKYGLKG